MKSKTKQTAKNVNTEVETKKEVVKTFGEVISRLVKVPPMPKKVK